MINLLPFLLGLGGVISAETNVYDYYNHLVPDEQCIIDSGNYSALNVYSNGVSYDELSYNEIISHLNEKYPTYKWELIDAISTKDASNAIPREMQSDNCYPEDVIKEFCHDLGLKTGYGGCGPIAMMGILDYFSYHLDYNEIVNDPSRIEDQKKIIYDVLTTVKTYEVGFGDEATLQFPDNMVRSFDKLMSTYGLQDRLKANYILSLTGNKDKLYNIIYENIQKGYPVTLGIGSLGNSDVYGHYTNIYSIARFSGINENGDYYFKEFLGLRLNLGKGFETYFDSEILNSLLTTIVTYNNAELKETNLTAQTFNQFVNDDGKGQYFFYEKYLEFRDLNNFWLETRRLRTGFIEKKYLVMSPNRSGAGEAYLDLNFYPSLTSLEFDSSLWGSKEFIDGQSFKLQYLKDNTWYDFIEYNLDDFSKSKEMMNRYYCLLPSYPSRIRFITNHPNPTATMNRGRICLDNITLEYDREWW